LAQRLINLFFSSRATFIFKSDGYGMMSTQGVSNGSRGFELGGWFEW